MLIKITCITRSVHGLKRRGSGCLKGEAAITAPSCSQLQAGWRCDVSLIATLEPVQACDLQLSVY